MTKPKRRKSKAEGRTALGERPRLTGARLVYGALRRAIVVLDIEPGAALEEGQLCRQYKVSRTPVREALIRLASEGLVDLEPNRGAKVAALQFIDVVDHYEAMDVFQPVTWHFAAVRRTDEDLDKIRRCLEALRFALAREDSEAIILSNYDIHRAAAAACHNRSLEQAYGQMLVDKLRVAHHAMRGLARNRGHVLATRFSRTFEILERLVSVVAAGDGKGAERLARELNAHVREQIVEILSTSLAEEIEPPRPLGKRPGDVTGARAESQRSSGRKYRPGHRRRGVSHGW